MTDVLVERDGAVATVVFNRPRMRNGISLAMWTEIARVTGDDLERVTYDYLRAVADNAPLSVRGSKLTVELYLEGLDDDRRARLRALSREAYESQDYKEGTRAFLEKRPPRFQGR